MTSALTAVVYGNRVTSNPADDWTGLAAGTLRVTHEGKPTDNFWCTDLGFWGGERISGSTPTVWMAIYVAGDPTPGSAPTVIVDQWGTAFTVGADYEDEDDPGTSVEHNTSLDGQIWSNKIYAIGPLTLTNGLGVAVRSTLFQSMGNVTAYNQSGLSALPDPFAATSTTSSFGRLYAWATGWKNEVPLAPASISPSGTVFSLTPTFSGTFRDLNGSYGTSLGTGLDQGDEINQLRIQVREVGGDGTLFWNPTYSATAAEKLADAYSRTYSGTVLVRGTDYEQRSQVSDMFGEFGAWTGWTTFTPADAGVITVEDDPEGKLEVITGIDFEGRWTHATSLAMEEVLVRLYDADTSSLLQQSPVISKAAAHSAAPGTLFTVTWAETTFDDLAWNKRYYYAMSGKDSDDVWTNYYGSIVPMFWTNAAPTIPTGLSPNNAQVYTTPPQLSAVMSDSDDTSGTGLTALFAGISEDDGVVSVAGTYNSGTGRWEAQLTVADLTMDEMQRVRITSSGAPTGGTYTLSWNGQTTAPIAYDAINTTVDAALEALSNIAAFEVQVFANDSGNPRDFNVTFRNGLGDTDVALITINVAGLTGGSGHADATTETIKGGIHYGVWTWQAYGYDGTLYSGEFVSLDAAGGSTPATFIYAVGPTVTFTNPTMDDVVATSSMTVTWTTTDQQKYQVILYEDGGDTIIYDSGLTTSTTSGHTIPSGSYSNDTAYDLYVSVQNSLLLDGASSIDISIDYGYADMLLNVQASPVYADSFDPVETAVLVTWGQTTYPTVGDTHFVSYLVYMQAESGVDSTRVQISEPITSPTTTSFTYYHPASDIEYTYEVIQVVAVGADEITSEPATATATVSLGRYHVFALMSNAGVYRSVLTNVREKSQPAPITNRAQFVSISGNTTLTVGNATYIQARAFEAAVIADDFATAEGRLAALKELDQQLGPVCFRDGAGDKMFATMEGLSITAEIGDVSGRWYSVALGLRAETVTEGS